MYLPYTLLYWYLRKVLYHRSNAVRNGYEILAVVLEEGVPLR